MALADPQSTTSWRIERPASLPFMKPHKFANDARRRPMGYGWRSYWERWLLRPAFRLTQLRLGRGPYLYQGTEGEPSTFGGLDTFTGRLKRDWDDALMRQWYEWRLLFKNALEHGVPCNWSGCSVNTLPWTWRPAALAIYFESSSDVWLTELPNTLIVPHGTTFTYTLAGYRYHETDIAEVYSYMQKDEEGHLKVFRVGYNDHQRELTIEMGGMLHSFPYPFALDESLLHFFAHACNPEGRDAVLLYILGRHPNMPSDLDRLTDEVESTEEAEIIELLASISSLFLEDSEQLPDAPAEEEEAAPCEAEAEQEVWLPDFD